jgi:hypothetical protein
VAVFPIAEDLVLPFIKRYELRFDIIQVIIIVPLFDVMMLVALLSVH